MRAALACVLTCGLSFAACGGGGHSSGMEPSAPTTTKFQGTFAGTGDQSGTLDIEVQAVVAPQTAWLDYIIPALHAQSTPSVSGTITTTSGSATSVTGTYNTSTNALQLSGGGFTFTGSRSGSSITGTFTGPSGSTGGFSTLNATAGSVTVYCGTFTSLGGKESGIFNIQTSSSGTASGTSSTSRGSTALTGTVTGSTLQLTVASGGTMTGAVSGGTVSGTGSDDTVFAGSSDSCNARLSTAPNQPAPPTPTSKTYIGLVSGQYVAGTTFCKVTFTVSGSVSITLQTGNTSGTLFANLPNTVSANTCGRTGGTFSYSGAVSIAGNNISFSGSQGSGGGATAFLFTGSLSGNAITGTVTLSESGPDSSGVQHSGSGTFPVTLR